MAALSRRRRLPSLTLNTTNVAATTVSDPSAATNILHLPVPPALPCSSTVPSTSDLIGDFEKLEVIGRGNGGTVYKARHRGTSSLFALKVLHQHSDNALQQQIQQEISILRRINSPFVVRCNSIFPPSSSGGDFAFVLEYMDGGDLDTLVRRHHHIEEPPLSEIARQALLGLSYLHSNRIVHRDIKPSNFLINGSGEIKIADFGVSELLSRPEELCDTYVGTTAYMSPERFDPCTFGTKYDGYAADVWSLGITILELYMGHYPLLPKGQSPDWASLMCAICFGESPTSHLPESVSDDFRSFLGPCLEKEASRRSTVDELLRHPFVARPDRTESRTAFMELLMC